MIDHALIDMIFDACFQEHGTPPTSFMFDRRILMPLTMLPEAVRKETGYDVSYDDLLGLLEAGWFERLEYAGANEDELGVPLYAPSRIGLFLDLKREHSYTDEELADFAREEDSYVTNVLSAGEFSYEDDDLFEVARHYEEEITRIEEDIAFSERPREPDFKWSIPRLTASEVAELQDRKEKCSRFAQWYRSTDACTLSSERRLEISRIAFHIRSYNDTIRFMLINQDRMKAKAGYSPGLAMRGESFGLDFYAPGEIEWAASLFGPGLSESEFRRLRVPGAVLDGRTVTLTRSPKPGEYERIWKEFDLEEYFALYNKAQGERVCRNCLAPLAADADERRRYCSEPCRHAAKQKRHRSRNPRAAAQAQWKYWNSVPEPKPAG